MCVTPTGANQRLLERTQTQSATKRSMSMRNERQKHIHTHIRLQNNNRAITSPAHKLAYTWTGMRALPTHCLQHILFTSKSALSLHTTRPASVSEQGYAIIMNK